MDIAIALTAVSTSLGILKELQEINKGVEAAEFKLKIAELASQMADAKLALIDVQDQLTAKDKEIGQLRKDFAIRAETVEIRGFKYEQKDGKPEGRAFCPRCETIDGLMIRVVKVHKPRRPYACPQCKQEYYEATEYKGN